DEDAALADLENGSLDIAPHQRACQYKRSRPRQPRGGPDGLGDRRFADQWDCIDRNPLSPKIMAVRLGNSANRYLPYLSAAADDDQPLTEDLPKSAVLNYSVDSLQNAEVRQQGVVLGEVGDLESDRFNFMTAVENRDGAD